VVKRGTGRWRASRRKPSIAEYAETRAGVAEAESALSETRGNLERARQLRDKGFFSAQQLTQAQAAADTAQARTEAAKARLQTAGVRKSKTNVLSPDAGIISARNATLGATVQPGQELFRLIRGGRLEWRAEVGAADLARIPPGTSVTVTTPAGERIEGNVRTLAPTVDPRTHTALVYVDLPADAAKRISAGMFARGEFRLGDKPALTVPQSALLLREGFAYVFRVESRQGATSQGHARSPHRRPCRGIGAGPGQPSWCQRAVSSRRDSSGAEHRRSRRCSPRYPDRCPRWMARPWGSPAVK
jgi:RND family efflux transporter MFP subunit